MDWRLIVPGETKWSERMDEAREVRLRPGQPAAAVMPDGVWRGSHILSPEEVTQAAQALTGYALASRSAEAAAGYMPLPGGHRLGICGAFGPGGLREIASLCVRVAHEIKGVGEGVFPYVRGRHTLIVGPPGAGKTTLLRDLIRLYSLSGRQAGVADCRGEIAACISGRPQLDVGPMTDAVSGLCQEKALPLLIRSMSPQVVAADEIGGEGDAGALLEAARCGVIVLSAAHGKTPEDVAKRPSLNVLFRERLFEAFVILRAPGEKPEVLTAKEG